MVKFLNLNLFLLFTTPFLFFSQDTRVVKGIVTEGKNEILIGARVEEYGNIQNYTLTNIDGAFEITIPKKNKVLLRITYGCSAFYEVLYKVEKEEDYVKIHTVTKTTDRNTKRIRRKLKFKKY